MKDNNSLAQTIWDCKYHVVFAPKCGRQIIYGKYRYGNRKFWCRGYYVNTVGRNREKIQQYIREQLREDYVADQLSLFEEYDPFTGQKNSKKK